MKTEILRILRNSDQYVSGQELCEGLGVSRTAVWKVINQLKEEGYNIEAVSNKGYLLTKVPDVVSTAEIESRVTTKTIGRTVLFYQEVDSTNTIAKKIAEEPNTHGTLVIAEKQNMGKGRRGRSWSSPEGSGVWMTLVLKPNIYPRVSPMLTLVAALSVVKSIRELYKLEALIKWPNDIVIHGKKVSGILTEMSAEVDYINHVVIGIGINGNTTDFPKDISNRATSLFLERKEKILRAELIANIMKEFEQNYEIFLRSQSLEELSKEYNHLLVNVNQEVKIIENDLEYYGIALGINDNGELIIREANSGNIKSIKSGEVSVRGLYGYV